MKFVAFTNLKFKSNEIMLQTIKEAHQGTYTMRYEHLFDKRYILETLIFAQDFTPLKRISGHFNFKGEHSSEDSIFYLNSHLRRLIKDMGFINTLQDESEYILNLNDDSSSGKRTRIQKMIDLYHERKGIINRRRPPSEVMEEKGFKFDNDENGTTVTVSEPKHVNTTENNHHIDANISSEKLQSDQTTKWKELLNDVRPLHKHGDQRMVELENNDLELMREFLVQRLNPDFCNESKNLAIRKIYIYLDQEKITMNCLVVK